MVDPDVAFGGYCCKICHATAGVQRSALCGQEVAKAWMVTATAVHPVEPLEPTFRKLPGNVAVVTIGFYNVGITYK